MDYDVEYMELALEEAKKAYGKGDVPVGAVIVYKGRVIAADHNRREEFQNATAHAELLVIKQACAELGSWRLPNCTLYVTLEPCPMCAGALVNARCERIVYGTKDPKAGAAGSVLNVLNNPNLNHRLSVSSGIMEGPCKKILEDFFLELRKK